MTVSFDHFAIPHSFSDGEQDGIRTYYPQLDYHVLSLLTSHVGRDRRGKPIFGQI